MWRLFSVHSINKTAKIDLQHILVFRDLPYVFAEDLLGLCPDQEVELTFDVVLRMSLISKAPY